MKKILALFSFAMIINMTNAQSAHKDSLKTQLSTYSGNDTSKALLLAELSKSYGQSFADSSLIFAMEGYIISKKNHFPKGEQENLNRMGTAYTHLGDYSQALKDLLQSLKINEKIKNGQGEIANFNNIGGIYTEQGDYQKSLEYLYKAKYLSEILNTPSPIILVNIGENYYYLKRYDSAKIFAQLANNMAMNIDLYRVVGNSYKIMGDISFETNQNNLALEYYRLAIPYLFKSTNFIVLSSCYNGMAKAFENSENIDSALYYGRQAYAIAKNKGFAKQLLDASSFFSSFYRRHRNSDSLIFYMDVAKVVTDSLFSKQKLNELHSLAFDEKIRQQELQIEDEKLKEDRRYNLQLAAILIVLITFIILFFILSRTIIVKTKFIEFFGVLGLLAVFEFINLFIHPYLVGITNDSPILMLGILIVIGGILVPFHHKLEKWITQVIVEKNKRIRLNAARKTIAKLEG